MKQETFRKLISGHDNDLAAELLGILLGGAAKVYSAVIRLRNFLYSKGWLKIHTVDVPVISIGNITVGGTGKTPLVIWLYKFLEQKGVCCAILTRGYKTKSEKLSDEPAILARSCPEARVVINPDRAAGAAKAVGQFGSKVLILDDGFQHRRLGRELDIVTIDGTRPFGYGKRKNRIRASKTLPVGLLREPPISLKRADAVVITRCDQTSETELAQLEEQLREVDPEMIIARSVHRPVCARALGQKEIGLEELEDKKIFAFCGIGNPDAFLQTVKTLGVETVGSKIYNDHHQYTEKDITDIYEEARYLNVDMILSTQKDWTKTALLASVKKEDLQTQKKAFVDSEGMLFAHLVIELKFTAGEEKLKQLIEEVLAGKICERQEEKSEGSKV